MDALIPALVVTLLCEVGDRTQALAMLLGSRYRRPWPVLAGIAFASAATMALGAAAGAAMAQAVDHRALRLMTGLALVLAGGGGLFRAKPPPAIDGWRLGALLSSAGAFFILAFGERSQFVVAALSGASGHPVLAALGATLGTTIANVPAVLLGERWPRLVPLRRVRTVAGALLVMVGLVVAVQALGLTA